MGQSSGKNMNGRWKIGRDQMPRKWGERRGRQRMRWEDCIKRVLKSMEGIWKTTAKDRRLLMENVVRENTTKKTTLAMVNHS